MRILLLNYEFPPAGGGAGFATRHIGRELVRLGVQVDILTARIENEQDGLEVDGMRVYRVPSWRKAVHDCGLVGAYSYVAFAYAKRRHLLKANRYDLEHFFFSMPTGALTLLPFTGPRPPYLVSLRGSDVPGYDPFNRTVERMHRMLLPLTRRIWNQAAAVVALSQGLQEIAYRTAPQLDIKVIPNGIDENHFCPSREPSVFRVDRPLWVILVSRLLERKGIHHLLEAIAQPEPLPVELEIVGTGSYEKALRMLSTKLGIADRVRFAGFVRTNDLPSHYQAADLFALPSQTESFGLVFAEAMACGLPVLATRVGGIPELVRDGVDGLLVEPASPVQLRESLKHLLAYPDKLQAMGQSARQRIEDEYTWRATAARYLGLCEQILSKSTGPEIQT